MFIPWLRICRQVLGTLANVTLEEVLIACKRFLRTNSMPVLGTHGLVDTWHIISVWLKMLH